MRKLYVPISAASDIDHESMIRDLHAMGADTVFLANPGRFCFERNHVRDEQLRNIKEKKELYESAGFEVGIWILALGFGGKSLPYNAKAAQKYTRIKSTRGEVGDDAICPLDTEYTHAMCTLVEDLAAIGLKMIMFDDEFCLNIRPGLGCACDLHLQKLREYLGEDIAREDIEKKVYSGSQSKYRDAWIAVMGDSLRDFARKMRESADKVDPSIRMGFCSGYTSWDLEGADAIELTKIFAGDNKPFLRYTGAPYWVPQVRFKGQSLQTIVEAVRMQAAWIKNEEIEAFGEGDTYPRSRFHSPAAFAELYDMALIVENIANLKYYYSYSFPHDFDSYYVNAHKRNMSMYESIEKAFSDKRSVGIRVYEEMRKFKNYDLPKAYLGGRNVMYVTMFSNAQAILTAHAIPTVYEGEGLCSICFGENAKYIDENVLRGGLILDARAAEILESRGFDVGLASSEPLLVAGGREIFDGGYTTSPLIDSSQYRKLVPKEGAEVISRFRFTALSPELVIPSAYKYENAKGERFLVFGFAGDEQADSSATLLSYSRGEQIKDALPWLCGKALPARCKSSPYLYSIVKENDTELAVAYFNMHADEVYDLDIELERNVKDVTFIGCDGYVTDEKHIKINYIKPFGFAAINVVKKGEL